MAITTTARAKTILGIKTADNDLMIEMLIPMIEDQLKAMTFQTFKDQDGNDSYPPGAELTAIRMLGFQMDSPDLQSESLEGYSMTRTNTASGYPANIEKMINALKRPKFATGTLPITVENTGWWYNAE